MKKISELGLELIELEDQVLLVDKNREYQTNGWAFNTGKGVFWVDMSDRYPSGYKFIASTKPLEGLPLFVIEDESLELAKNDPEGYYETDYQSIFVDGYVRGYKKAKERFKFTEEDMIEFSIWRSTTIFSEPLTPIGQFEKWKSLTKKELWIEVEEWSLAENVEAKNQNVPKIINNQIKGIYR